LRPEEAISGRGMVGKCYMMLDCKRGPSRRYALKDDESIPDPAGRVGINIQVLRNDRPILSIGISPCRST